MFYRDRLRGDGQCMQGSRLRLILKELSDRCVAATALVLLAPKYASGPRWHAGPQTYGTDPARVASGTTPGAGARKTAEVDVAVFGRGDDDQETLLAIGEAKWRETMTAAT
jgi:hypothetical protein